MMLARPDSKPTMILQGKLQCSSLPAFRLRPPLSLSKSATKQHRRDDKIASFYDRASTSSPPMARCLTKRTHAHGVFQHLARADLIVSSSTSGVGYLISLLDRACPSTPLASNDTLPLTT